MSTVRSIEELRSSQPSDDGSHRKLSFKERQLLVREDAIIAAVNQLLATKGYEWMTMDEVAAEVGIAKASLYKHFASKEALAAAAMVRLLQATVEFVNSLDSAATPLAKIRQVLHWALHRRLQGNLPLLPSTNSALREAYMNVLNELSNKIGGWIETAQANGDMPKQVPALALLYSVYSRTCDPTMDYLKMSGQFSDEQIVDWMIEMCFNGLAEPGAEAKSDTKSRLSRA
jgi:TetR/AcrR family transcriptional regulator, regulator of autoinduction and epiphytic fitness